MAKTTADPDVELFTSCLDAATQRAGAGWDLLGAGFQRALVAEEILKLRFRVRHMVPPEQLTASITRLYEQMMTAFPDVTI